MHFSGICWVHPIQAGLDSRALLTEVGVVQASDVGWGLDDLGWT